MKPTFSKSGRRLQAMALPLLAGLILCPLAGTAAIPTYINKGTIAYYSDIYNNTVSSLPQIDATNFYNSGIWDVYTLEPLLTLDYVLINQQIAYINSTIPYKTTHTLNYTNKGTMTGSVGWEFDYGTGSGGRGMSASFFNDSSGTIRAVDGTFDPLPENILNPTYYTIGYLLVSATNIVNKGSLIAGANGEIILTGSSVNLSRSLVEISPIASVGSLNGVLTNHYSPDVGIYDLYWGTTNDLYVGGSWWDGIEVDRFSGSDMAVPCGLLEDITIGPFVPTVIDSVSNNTGLLTVTATNADQTTYTVLLATNQFRQGVFVLIGNDAINGQIRFVPSGNPTNLFETVAVQLSTVNTNAASGQPQTSDIYLVDTLARDPFLALLPDYQINPASCCSGPTYRPTNYLVSRSDPGAFGAGSPGLGTPPADFYYDPLTFTNFLVTGGWWAAHSALVDNQAAEGPPYGSVTNLPGRVRVYADNLNLNQARVSAEGEIVIQTPNLTDSANAVMDCQNLSFNLGTTNGSLNFTNLAFPFVNRLNGTNSMWSGVWTNYAMIITTNYMTVTNPPVAPSTNTTTSTIRADLTNMLQINLYIFVVDASGLKITAPVTVYDLLLHSTNNVGNTNSIVIGDSVSVVESFLLDCQSFTLDGNLTFPGISPMNPVSGTPYVAAPIQNWVYAMAPTLSYFTNNGSLSIPNDANFGDDGPANYMAFVNNGFISAGDQTINSYYFENDGTLNTTVGDCYVTTATGKFQNGKVASGADIQFFANNLKFNQSTLQASGGELDFTATNSLADTGGGSGNSFTCKYGFNLWIKPRLGDLLGTTMNTVAPTNLSIEVDHYWAGTNCGPVNSGYSNNVALGQLVLAPQGSLVTDPPLFFFAGATGGGVTNGLYVDLLDLSALGTNWDNIQQHLLQIDPSLVIYYAAAKLGFTPPPAVPGLPPQEPEEFLNGQFGGHLRWVQTFAGPNSSVAVLINGQSYEFNKALRFATTIDSNSNGIPNYADPNPFSAPSAYLTLTNVPPGAQSSPIVFALYSYSYTTNTISTVITNRIHGRITGYITNTTTTVITNTTVNTVIGTRTNQSSSSVPALSWVAFPNTVYNVQFTTNLAPANWQPLLTYTNNVPIDQMVTVFDTNAPAAAAKRFYRVYSP